MYSVYKHTAPNGKIYIGVTGRAPEKRWQGKYQNNALFAADIAFFGWENIKHEVLYAYETKDEAYAKERELIAFYKSNDPRHGYNKAAGGHGATGTKRTEESKEKTRRAMIGVKHTPERKENLRRAALLLWSNIEHREKMSSAHKGKHKGKDSTSSKPVIQLSLDGVFIAEFDCMRAAQEATGIDRRAIGSVCSGVQRQTHGYKWKYKKAGA